jgi:hypothetical protein
MKKVIHGLGIAAILGFVAGANTGCSVIGYQVGGDIDGKPEMDLKYVNYQIDSASRAHLTSLATKAQPGEGYVVKVSTRDHLFKGDGFAIGTVVAVKGDSVHRGSEGLIRGRWAVPDPSARFVQVPGLVLGEESPPHFIPLQEVQWISATRTAEDIPSTGRTIGLVVGVALDIAAVAGITYVVISESLRHMQLNF